VQVIAEPTHLVHGSVQAGHVPLYTNVPDGHIEVHFLVAGT